MAIHAALHHDARVVGITISRAQAALARQRVEEAGVADRVEIRLQDYRDLGGETVRRDLVDRDVGARRPRQVRPVLRRRCASVLGPQGRLLNHAISSVGGSKLGRSSFVGRYVFPDGELIDVGEVVLSMERSRVRGPRRRIAPRALRPHACGRGWSNLESRWDEAVKHGRRAAGQDLAAVHGRLGGRLRRRRDRASIRCSASCPVDSRQRRACRRRAATGAELGLRTTVG